MARTNNLSEFLTDVADAIRTKKGTSDSIPAENFDAEIADIETGVDTSDATAVASNIKWGETAYVNGEKITGTLGEVSPITNFSNPNHYTELEIGDTPYPGFTAMGCRNRANEDEIFIKDGYINLVEKNTKLAESFGITPEKIVSGNTILDVVGTAQTGTDTSDATATSGDIEEGKTAYINGEKVTGSVPVLTNIYDPGGDFQIDIIPPDDPSKVDYMSPSRLYIEGDIQINGSGPFAAPHDKVILPTGTHIRSGMTVEQSVLAQSLGITPEMIVEYEKILGVRGTAKTGVTIREFTSSAEMNSTTGTDGELAYINVLVPASKNRTQTIKSYFKYYGNKWNFLGNEKVILPASCSNLFSNSSFVEFDSNFYDTSNVTDMSAMFGTCEDVTSLDLSNFDTSSVTNMSSMFFNCDMLTSLDLRNWDTSSVTNTDGMFARIPADCKILVSTQEMKDWVLGVRSDLTNVVVEGESATGTGIKTFSSEEEMNASTGNIDGDLASIGVEVPINASETQVVRKIYSYSGNKWNFLGNEKVVLPTNCYRQFGGSEITEFDSNFYDTSNVENMNSMFDGCTNLKHIDLSNFDTSSVEQMDAMFYDCTSLEHIDVSNFDTSNVECVWNMFSGCTSLTSVDVSSWDTSEMGSPDMMFDGCTSLQHVDLRNFTYAVVDAMWMFRGVPADCEIIVSSEYMKHHILQDEIGDHLTNIVVMPTLDTEGYNTALETTNEILGREE